MSQHLIPPLYEQFLSADLCSNNGSTDITMTSLWTTSSAVFSLNSDGRIFMKRSGIVLIQAQVGIKITLPEIPLNEVDINTVAPSGICVAHNGDPVDYTTCYHQSCLHHHSLNVTALLNVDVGDTLNFHFLSPQHKISLVESKVIASWAPTRSLCSHALLTGSYLETKLLITTPYNFISVEKNSIIVKNSGIVQIGSTLTVNGSKENVPIETVSIQINGVSVSSAKFPTSNAGNYSHTISLHFLSCVEAGDKISIGSLEECGKFITSGSLFLTWTPLHEWPPLAPTVCISLSEPKIVPKNNDEDVLFCNFTKLAWHPGPGVLTSKDGGITTKDPGIVVIFATLSLFSDLAMASPHYSKLNPPISLLRNGLTTERKAIGDIYGNNASNLFWITECNAGDVFTVILNRFDVADIKINFAGTNLLQAFWLPPPTLILVNESALRRKSEAVTKMQIKRLYLRFFNMLKGDAAPFAKDPEVLLPSVQLTERLFDQGEPLSLFPDWSPPRYPPEELIVLNPDTAVASSSATSYPASAPVEITVKTDRYWRCSEAKQVTNWWQIQLTSGETNSAVNVSSIVIHFEDKNGHNYGPAALNVLLSLNGKDFTPACPVIEGEKLRGKINIRIDNSFATHIRIQMNGFHDSNKDSIHGISFFSASTESKGGDYSPEESLLSLQQWLIDILENGKDDDLRESSFRALLQIYLKSGSLATILRLMKSLFINGFDNNGGLFFNTNDDERKQACSVVMDKVLDFLKSHLTSARIATSKLESDLFNSLSSGSGLESIGEIPCTFDPEKSSSGITFKDDMLTAQSISSPAYSLVGVGPFTSGCAAWEFKLVEDTASQCSCFGAAVWPIHTSNYESSSEMWMYRAYNGYLYNNGQTGKICKKISKGDVVRVEVDMDAGTMRFLINGEDQSICFTNLSGKAIYPAVNFYSAGRHVTLLKVEGPVSDGVLDFVWLSDLEEKNIILPIGAFWGKNGKYGHTLVEGKPSFEGRKLSRSISITPSAGGANISSLRDENDLVISISYDLKKQYETFKGHVCLDESVHVDKIDQDFGVTFEVWNADRNTLIWSQNLNKRSLTTFKSQISYNVDVLGVITLTLKVLISKGTTLPKEPFTVLWVDPCLSLCGDWPCAECSFVNQSTEFTCNLCNNVRGSFPVIVCPTFLDLYERDSNPFMRFSRTLLWYLGELSDSHMRRMRHALLPLPGEDALVDLEEPLVIQINEDVLVLLTELSGLFLEDTFDHYHDVGLALLKILKVNLRRLIVSCISADMVGITVEVTSGIYSLLQTIEGSQAPRPLILEAAEVYRVAEELLIRSKSTRISHVKNALESATVIEIQANWPTLGEDFDDTNCSLERLLLLIQLVASKNKFRFRLFGRWPASAHLVLEIPSNISALDILSGPITDCFTQAGFLHWSYLEGSTNPNIVLVLEPHYDFVRLTRTSQEEGAGFVRVYSRASFEEVTQSVRNYLPLRNKENMENSNNKHL